MDRPFPAYNGNEPYVFVSYSHGNSSAVYPELVWLKESGFNIWFDEGIEAGTEWREEIANAITNTGLFIYFVTSDSVQSENCRKEVNLADKLHIPILAIYLEATELSGSLDLTLSDHQAILKYEVTKQEYRQKLQARISSYLDQPIIEPVIVKQKKTVPILAGLATVALLAIGLFFYNQQDVQQTIDATQVDLAAMRSIAVLPFANTSTNEETGFFADGLSEDILDNLAQLDQIKVASRSDSFQFKDRGEDSSIIGEKLKVAYLLEGSVRQQGDDLRITAQLIRTEDGFHVWSKSYERTQVDGFEMQTAVAANIAYITGSKLIFDVLKNYGWKQQERFDGIDAVAVKHYMSALNEYNNIRIGEGGDWNTRVQFLKNAVQVDPNFYLAYTSLASAYRESRNLGRLSLQEARPAAHAAIASAIALAPDNFNSQFIRTLIHHSLDLDYARAEAGLRQILKLSPKFAWSHYFLAAIDLREGRTSEALRQMTIASGVNAGTEQAIFLAGTAWIRCIGGDYEKALQVSALGLKLALGGQDSATNLRIHAFSLIMLGRVEEAKPFIEEGWKLDVDSNPENYVSLFVFIGETEKAKKILTDVRFDLVNHYELAIGHLSLGDIDNTFKSIQAGIEDHNPYLLDTLLVAEWWNPIRDDPRFDEMLELLDSKVTHTEQYLHDHKITQADQ